MKSDEGRRTAEAEYRDRRIRWTRKLGLLRDQLTKEYYQWDYARLRKSLGKGVHRLIADVMDLLCPEQRCLINTDTGNYRELIKLPLI